MTASNRNTLWAETLVDELSENGVRAVCLAPGSRSTPLTVAFASHPEIETFSHLDERSAAFFALGRARRTGRPTPVVCTSGTAAANFHPAVLEADEGRVPLLVLTADRPPELRDSGANQTTDQEKLYGNAVRWYQTLAEPEANARKLRSLRTTATRAVDVTTGTPPGPVHLNVPFRKPLEPTPVAGDIPAGFETDAPLAVNGRDGPFVDVLRGRSVLDSTAVRTMATALGRARRGLIVCGPADSVAGPADDSSLQTEALSKLARASRFPVLADPLSDHRFGSLVTETTVCGGYDSYLDGAAEDEAVPDPEVVVRFGASPTSKVLRTYLASLDVRQFVVDPAGGWPEAEFTATDLVVASPRAVAETVATRLQQDTTDTEREAPSRSPYQNRFEELERKYWEFIEKQAGETLFEGNVLRTVCQRVPDPSTVFVSNSMPIRDADRFGQPRDAAVTVLGNRGVSGIDGVVSTALGAGSATDEPLVLVLGDIALYHDMNGLLALERCGVDATIVLVDNDGGGIFHMLPIEAFEPPFTEQFRTPHGLRFEAVAELYDLDFETIESLERFTEAFDASLERTGTQLLRVSVDAAQSHRFREELHEQARSVVRE